MRSEQGHVLFLILIFAVLFAALTYAVTRTARVGGGETESEKAELLAAQTVQYTAHIRKAVMTMTIGNDVPLEELNFLAIRSQFCSRCASDLSSRGGGVPYAKPDPAIFIPGQEGTWKFYGDMEVADFGLTTGTVQGVDVVAVLRNLNMPFCTGLDERIGMNSIPIINTALNFGAAPGGVRTYNPANVPSALQHSATLDLSGQTYAVTNPTSSNATSACFQNGAGGEYIFYDILSMR